MKARTLAVLTSVHGARDGDRLILDDKALQGIELYRQFWPGEVVWLLAMKDAPPSYSTSYEPADLPVRVIEIKEDRSDLISKIPSDALVLANADNHADLALADELADRLIYVIEYTLKTRLDIITATDAPWWRKLRRAMWERSMERKRVKAIAKAAGLQCNGLASYDAYACSTRSPIHYFDTRLGSDWQIDAHALAAKCARALEGAPLRIAFSGRLTRMKGAHYLPPIAEQLNAAGIAFTFEIFGEGDVALGDAFTMRGPLAFPEEWVPAMRKVDLFICPHPQGDPSCTYMEVMGCGVPIIGFDNEALRPMLSLGDNGLAVPIGDVAALVSVVKGLDEDRGRLTALMKGALSFASAQPMEEAFRKRVQHLKDLAV